MLGAWVFVLTSIIYEILFVCFCLKLILFEMTIIKLYKVNADHKSWMRDGTDDVSSK